MSALDPFLKIRMRAELKKLQTSLGITFVHVTHSQEEAMALADLIVVMNDGRIEQAATPREVFEQPATAFVARFMGDHNVLSGRVERTAMEGHLLKCRWRALLRRHGSRRRPIGEAACRYRHPHRPCAHRRGMPAGLGFDGIVSNVEYRGAKVKLTVSHRLCRIEDSPSSSSDASLFRLAGRRRRGVPLSWDPADSIVLGRS